MNPTMFLSRLQFVGAFLLLGGGLYLFRGPWTALRITGLALAAPAFLLFLVAKTQLGSSFSVEARAQTLVAHGIYARIRHPMYLFSALLLLGLILYSQDLRFLLIFLVIVPMQFLRMRREDQVLESAFGDEYRRYRQHTWF